MRHGRRPRPHVYWPDGIRDAEGQQGCRLCPLPRKNKIHRVNQATREAAELHRRILGERDRPAPPPTLF